MLLNFPASEKNDCRMAKDWKCERLEIRKTNASLPLSSLLRPALLAPTTAIHNIHSLESSFSEHCVALASLQKALAY